MLNKKVLVIDDDRTMCSLLEKWLRNDGYRVVLAQNGEQGLKIAHESLPDCIVLDLMIPDMSGLQIAKKFLGDPQTAAIPMVFITMTLGVENDKGDETLVIDDQSFPAFAKPLHQRKFLSVIRKEINKRINNNK